MKKMLSIIIPTYNMERFLHKCLDSLIVSDGNMKRLEVLVVNDGSKDSSSQIAHEYEKNYPNTFKVIDKENGNYGSCINRGLKEASGKYIKVLDADDSYDTKVFDEYISYLSSSDADLVVSDFNIVDENGNLLKHVNFHVPTSGFFSIGDISRDDRMYLWHHAVAYKTDNVRSINYRQTEGISYTDEEWVFKPMITVHTALYFPSVVYLYLRGREGQTYDPAVLKKTYNQILVVNKSILSFYATEIVNLTNTDIFFFLHESICARMFTMYRHYLFDQEDDDGYAAIKDYDLYMKEVCPSLYSELDSMLFKPKIKYHYIRRWRRVDYDQADISLKLFRAFCKIIDNLRGLNRNKKAI